MIKKADHKKENPYASYWFAWRPVFAENPLTGPHYDRQKELVWFQWVQVSWRFGKKRLETIYIQLALNEEEYKGLKSYQRKKKKMEV